MDPENLPPITLEMEKLAEESRKNLEQQKPVTIEEARARVPVHLRKRTSPYKED